MNISAEQITDIAVVKPSGNAIDASVAAKFKAGIAPYVVPGAKVVIDLSQIGFIDSSGLGALVSTLKRLHEMGGDLKLCGLNKPIRALFELVRMHRVFEIFNTAEEAVRSYGS